MVGGQVQKRFPGPSRTAHKSQLENLPGSSYIAPLFTHPPMLSHARLCRRSVGVHSMRRWQSHSSNASSRGVCPSCSSPLPTPLPTCPKCSHIEPLPSTTTLFDVFGLHGAERTFSLDSKDLKTRFLKAQRVCHPDAWSGKGEVSYSNVFTLNCSPSVKV